MVGGGSPLSTPPPFVSSPLNKVLTSFLFLLLIRFPQKRPPVCAEGQDEVAGAQEDPPPTHTPPPPPPQTCLFPSTHTGRMT